MRIELADVAKGPARARALEPVSTVFETGRVTLVRAETEQRPTVLGLIASGRMTPDAGTVLLDGARDARGIRHRTALIDAPEVCEPAPDVTVYGVVEEELMFAGRTANLVAARRWLAAHDLAHLGRMPISAVAPDARIALLLELAVLRPAVDALVLVSPDRHGGDPRAWWRIAEEFAARGFAVLVVAGTASALVLEAEGAIAAAEVAAADPGSTGVDAVDMPLLDSPGVPGPEIAGDVADPGDTAEPDAPDPDDPDGPAEPDAETTADLADADTAPRDRNEEDDR